MCGLRPSKPSRTRSASEGKDSRVRTRTSMWGRGISSPLLIALAGGDNALDRGLRNYLRIIDKAQLAAAPFICPEQYVLHLWSRNQTLPNAIYT